MKVFKNVWALYQEQGWPGVCLRAVHSLWSRKKYIVYRKDICTADHPSLLPGVRFRLAGIHDLSWMCDQRDDLGDKAEPILRQQFIGKDMTAIGVKEGNQPELIFSTWISHEDYCLILLDDYIGNGDASLRRVWVRPTQRRTGLAKQGFSFVEYAAKEAGIPRLWSFALQDNVASINLHEKMGYRVCGHIHLIKRLQKRYVKIFTVWQRRCSVRMLPEGVVRL